MIFYHAQPNIFGCSQIYLALHPCLWRVLQNQSQMLIPSQIYSAVAKYIWRYIPVCDGFWKINHMCWYPTKTNWRTTRAPEQKQNARRPRPKNPFSKRPSYFWTTEVGKDCTNFSLNQIQQQQTSWRRTWSSSLNCAFFWQKGTIRIWDVQGKQAQIDMPTPPTKSHSCSPWLWLWLLWMPSLKSPRGVGLVTILHVCDFFSNSLCPVSWLSN